MKVLIDQQLVFVLALTAAIGVNASKILEAYIKESQTYYKSNQSQVDNGLHEQQWTCVEDLRAFELTYE